MFEPSRRLTERLSVQAQPVFAAADGALHESSTLEDLHMLGDSIERNGESINKTPDVRVALGEHGQDRPACRIGDCSVDLVQLVFNQSVEYYHAPR